MLVHLKQKGQVELEEAVAWHQVFCTLCYFENPQDSLQLMCQRPYMPHQRT